MDFATMATNYVAPMAEALQCVFIINSSDATELVLGGLGETTAYLASTYYEQLNVYNTTQNF